MNKYIIKYKIATVSELVKPFTFEGYEFSSYAKEWWNSDSWVATKEIEADDAGKAKYEFIKGLLPLIPEISVVSQCAFRFVANTFFIYRLTSNSEKKIFINFVREVPPVGLHFDDKEIENLKKIHDISNKHSLYYIADSAHGGSLFTDLTLLLIGVEGLAGEIETDDGRKMTNKEELKIILGDELFDKLYPYGVGLRNLLFHGNAIEFEEFDGLVEKVYARIRIYLKSKYDIALEENVIHPQRNFHNNFEQATTFEAFKNEPNLDLKFIHESFDNEQNRNNIFTHAEGVEDY